MSIVALRSASVGERCAALLGGFSVLVACGGIEPGTSGGGGGAPSGAGMTNGGSGASTTTGGTAGAPPTTGGVGAGAGTSSAGAGAGAPSGGTGAVAGAPNGGAGAAAGAPSGGVGGMGSGSGGVNAGMAGVGGSGGMQALSFRADIWPVFQRVREPPFIYPGGSSFESCVTGGVCHGGERPGAGLRMTNAEMAYGMLLGVASTTELCNGTTRVIAGNPAESCLILFYEGRLRDELDWVDDGEIDLVRRWIAEGALP